MQQLQQQQQHSSLSLAQLQQQQQYGSTLSQISRATLPSMVSPRQSVFLLLFDPVHQFCASLRLIAERRADQADASRLASKVFACLCVESLTIFSRFFFFFFFCSFFE
jgi:hypothetical protein